MEKINRKRIRYYTISKSLLRNYVYVWFLCISKLDMGVLMRCKYYNKCSMYDYLSSTCRLYEGDYGDRKASCKIKMEGKNGKE